MNQIQKMLTVTLLVAASLCAQSLTHIRDTIHEPDGTLFSGVVDVTPTPSESNAAPTPMNIYAGLLDVSLIAGTSYSVEYYTEGSDAPLWTEIWQVPVSSSTLVVADVLQPAANSAPATSPQIATLPISINEVATLPGILGYINQSLASLNTSVSSVQSLPPTVSALNNTVSSLSGSVNSLSTQQNLQTSSLSALGSNVGSLSGNLTTIGSQLATVAASVSSIQGFTAQNSNDIASLKTAVATLTSQMTALLQATSDGGSTTFVDGENPSGTIDGTNLTFLLTNSPSPSSSLQLWKNGVLLAQPNDFTLVGSAITFVSAAVPFPGDVLFARYHHQ
jgi:hypothetical protein